MKKFTLGIVLSSFVICMGSGIIDLRLLDNYVNQFIPSYITLDNTNTNEISDEVATLGRVLFYDTQLSVDNRTSCASCHKQELAFGDDDQVSFGSFGVTGRHSMRLVNARFSEEEKFFWDERAATLEDQVTMPIQDAVEMGFSGEFGNPGFDELIIRLEEIDYYNTLFEFAFGDSQVTEERMQLALAQFVRSMQSFDTRYDEGRAGVENDTVPFPNFTEEENLGKELFLNSVEFGSGGNRIAGGIGCANCHTAPEFSIIPNSRTNGVIVAANGVEIDETVTRSPSLRDIFNPNGELNGGLMHNGFFTDFQQVLDHYNDIEESTGIPNIVVDPRLKDGPNTQKLNMTAEEMSSVTAFLKTLTGSDLYTNEKWSNPFDDNGQLEVLPNLTSTEEENLASLNIYPNPAVREINIDNAENIHKLSIVNADGQLIQSVNPSNRSNIKLELSQYTPGIYIIIGQNENSEAMLSEKFVKL
ncbi:T9SS type A sorting domain-containing protein [Saprospiraceae bacterium]|nr:T9SS type A sorting domain-containing protein [Saprospiraceae bacterium]